MYQWGEKAETKTESQMGGSEKHTTTYTYNKTWSNKLIDSSTFKNQDGHVNPSGMLIHSEKQYAKIVTVGEFLLPNTLITRINKSEPVDLSQINQGSLKTEFNMPVSLANKELYFGQNSQTPQIGDLRLNMTAVYPQDVSIIGQQSGKTLQPYLAPAGETVMLLSTGQVSANQMIDDAKSQNKMMTWMFRLVSLILLIIGFSLIMKPVVILADVIPFLGTLVGYGTGFIAFICGLGLWLIVTAIAWFATRPFVSIGILLIVVAGGYWLIKSRKKGSSNTDLTHS